MRRPRNRIMTVLGACVLLIALTACAYPPPGAGGPDRPGPPGHAPAYGYRAQHEYYYYPSEYVYFDTGRRIYFFLEGANWRVSAALPAEIRVRLGDHVTIDMDDDKPYTQFDAHKKMYPPGQMKKERKPKPHDPATRR